MNESLWKFLSINASDFGIKLLQHIFYSLLATIIAVAIGVPLGILIVNKIRLKNAVLTVTSLFQTIPSLALLAFLIPFVGIGFSPTIITLTVYALLPIVRNTYTGLIGVPPESIEAAKAMGFKKWQRIHLVEIPLAMPTIMAGIRTSMAMTIGITTIAAFIGAGGLGDFITQGLALDSTWLILLGAIPTAILALALDFAIANIETLLNHRNRKKMKYKKIRLSAVLIFMLIILYFIFHALILPLFSKKTATIVIGSKNFTEQYILSEIMAQLIEAKTQLHVKRDFNLGSTTIVQNALIKGQVDLYAEYTGTAYLSVLKYKKLISAQQTYQIVKREYQKRFNLTWLQPFGFENSESIGLLQPVADKWHLNTLSDLSSVANQIILGVPPEFLKRPDGLRGLEKVYGFNFKKIIQIEPNLLYLALTNNSVDAIEVFTTDGRISEYHLKVLKDNKHFYPPYDAAPVIRIAFLEHHPQVRKVLNLLHNLISQKTMQQLNNAVDVKHETPRQVAHQFLVKQDLL